jgi:hypothetical protein
MNSRLTSSYPRRPTQQHSPSLGGQASLGPPSLGGSFGRRSLFYHPYGNTSSAMGDASLDGVSRLNGRSDGRGENGGHQQYGLANPFYPARLSTADRSWNQSRLMLSTDAFFRRSLSLFDPLPLEASLLPVGLQLVPFSGDGRSSSRSDRPKRLSK